MKYSNYTLISLIILSVLATGFKYNAIKQQEKEKTASLATIYADRFANALNDIVLETDSVENILLDILDRDNGEIKQEQYEIIATFMFNTDDYIGVSFLPKGVVEYIYPVEINKNALGHNVLKDDVTKLDALKAKESKKSVYSGPYQLRQGMSGIIVRNPVYYTVNNEEVFWGFIAVAIDTQVLIQKTGIKDLLDFDYEINIQSTYKGQTNDFYKSPNFKEENILDSHYIDIGEGSWHFLLYCNLANKNNANYIILFALTCLSFSLFAFFIVRRFEKRKKSSFEKSMIDSLTQVNNIKALQLFAKNKDTWSTKGFTLFYLDIEKFKEINTKYGSEIADKLLISLARRLKDEFTDDTFIARLKADEFVVIIPQSLDEYASTQIQNLLLNISEATFFINTKHINIKVAIGYAAYPRDGKNFNEVMSKADEKIYHYSL